MTAALPIGACSPDALSALGPVLCLHGAGDPHLLAGWSRATHFAARIGLDSEGPSESICFFNDAGCCWRLHRLPDSDFLAWERLLERTPAVPAESPRAASWLQRCKHAAISPWRACGVRLLAVSDATGTARLAATDVNLSRLGLECAQRIARSIGRATIRGVAHEAR